MNLPQLENARPTRKRKMLLTAVALASGVTLQCSAAGIGLFDSGLYCPAEGSFESYCGIQSVTTTCNGSVKCERGMQPTTTCTYPTPKSDCEITLRFDNGTQQTLKVSAYSNGPDCGTSNIAVAQPLVCGDGGTAGDASDAAMEASDAKSD